MASSGSHLIDDRALTNPLGNSGHQLPGYAILSIYQGIRYMYLARSTRTDCSSRQRHRNAM
jgi:hypothetical protein